MEEETEVRRPDLFVGVEAEVGQYLLRSLARVLHFLGLDFDLDELAEAIDRVERDGVSVQPVAVALFLHVGGGFEAQRTEYRVRVPSVLDGRFDLFARLGLCVHFRPLVGQLHDCLVPVGLPADAKRLVGLREVAVGRVVVRIRLGHGTPIFRPKRFESLANGVVGRCDLQFDFVHGQTNRFGPENGCRF